MRPVYTAAGKPIYRKTVWTSTDVGHYRRSGHDEIPRFNFINDLAECIAYKKAAIQEDFE